MQVGEQPGVTGAPQGVQQAGGQSMVSGEPQGVQQGGGQGVQQAGGQPRVLGAPQGEQQIGGQPGVTGAPQGVQKPGGQPRVPWAPQGAQQSGGRSMDNQEQQLEEWCRLLELDTPMATVEESEADEAPPMPPPPCPRFPCDTCFHTFATRGGAANHMRVCRAAEAERRAQALSSIPSLVETDTQERSTPREFGEEAWAGVTSWEWETFFSVEAVGGRTVRRIPQRARSGVLDALCCILKRLKSQPGDEAATLLLLTFPRLILAMPPKPGIGQKALITERLNAFWEGRWRELFDSAMVAARPAVRPLSYTCSDQDPDAIRLSRCRSRCEVGEWSRGLACLTAGELARPSEVMVQSLREKHPASAGEVPQWVRDFTIDTAQRPSLTTDILARAIHTAARASAAGPSGWVTEHLRDTFLTEPSCLSHLLEVFNQWVAGQVPERARPWLAASNLVGLSKPNGDVWPVAIGEVLPRILARALCISLRPALVSYFLPCNQLGAGTRSLESARGSRQGDPLGPFLFAFTQQQVMELVTREFKDLLFLSYADDTYILGPAARILEAFGVLRERLEWVGLEVQAHKCRFWEREGKEVERALPLGMQRVDEGLTVVGVPIGEEVWEVVRLRERLRQLQAPLPWLPLLDHPQMASHLLAIAVSARQMYLARTMPPRPEVVEAFRDWDSCLEDCFEQLFPPDTWEQDPDRSRRARIQLHVPVRLGGFGIRAAASLSPLSYVCGWAQAARDIAQLGVAGEEAMFAEYLTTSTGAEFLDPWFVKALEQLPATIRHEIPGLPLCVAAPPVRLFQARQRQLAGPRAGAWVSAVSAHSYLTFTAAEWGIAAAIRLGLPIQQLQVAGRYVCGTAFVDPADPHHALRCRHQHGPSRVHDEVKFAVAKISKASGGVVTMEDSVVLHGKRVDVAVRRPMAGEAHALEISVADPLSQSPSLLEQCGRQIGVAAREWERRKTSDYAPLLARNRGVQFTPLIVETWGCLGGRFQRWLRQQGDAHVGLAVSRGACREDDSVFSAYLLGSLKALIGVALQRAQARVILLRAASSMGGINVDLVDRERDDVDVEGGALWVEATYMIFLEHRDFAMLRTIGASSAALRRGASSAAAQCGGAGLASTIPSLPISPCHSRAALALVALSRSLASLHSPPVAPQIPLPQQPQNSSPTLTPASQQQHSQSVQQRRSLHSPASLLSAPAFRLPVSPLHSAPRAPFSSSADSSADPTEQRSPPTERVVRLADEIVGLTLLEVSDLTTLIRKKLGMEDAPMGGMPMGMMMMPGGAMPGGGGGGEAAPAAAVEEKTAFDVKLEGFDAAAKLKVIKEVRSIAGLGLKEAKEFVEKAPVVVKAGVSKEDAAAIAEKLKAVGATVVVE
ncbi:unnamed protein product [Closterium sp. NIES-65]|nr:unnamed protein product [Closterium sp. NIES-65]